MLNRLSLCASSIIAFVAISACTPEDRAKARTVIDTAAPILCPLFSLAGGDGNAAGLACKDAQIILDGLLATRAVSAERPSVTTVAAKAKECVNVPLNTIVPRGDDAREYVCLNYFGDSENEARANIRRAFGIGRATGK